jgi:hypothetical protein
MEICFIFSAIYSRPTSLLATNEACVSLYSMHDFKDYQQRINSAKDHVCGENEHIYTG